MTIIEIVGSLKNLFFLSKQNALLLESLVQVKARPQEKGCSVSETELISQNYQQLHYPHEG